MPPYELQAASRWSWWIPTTSRSSSRISSPSARRLRCRAGRTPRRSATTLIRNVGNGPKYPYNPYYGEFSPRVSFAWNPRYSDGILGKVFGSGKTVIRGGYGRIFGRLNGVDLVLVPLLGPGLLQGVTCVNPLSNGTCAGSGVATPQNAFRIGPDGLTAPLAAATSDAGAAVTSRVSDRIRRPSIPTLWTRISNRTVPTISLSPFSARSTRTCSSKWAISARSSGTNT